jgi:RNA polymerase sigma factor (sigma-70 family)
MATVLAPSRTDRAFERLYRRYVADVYRYVLAVLQNEADAEDATQQAFLCAYRAYERGERPERPLNWLIAIAHNVCRQRWRESARRPRVVQLEDEVPARAAEEESPNADEIRRALGFLAFNQRAALVMRELQGRSYEEIAGILGLSSSAVETLLFRARRALREQLEGGLSCGEAELALSRRADGQLTFAERGPLRAHLRECTECAALERRQRFRRSALKGLGAVPLPSSLGSFFGGGVAGTGAGIGAKAAAVVVAGMLGSGVSGDAIQDRKSALDEPARAAAAPARSAVAGTRATRPQPGVVRRTSLRERRAEPRRAVRGRAAAVRRRPSSALEAQPVGADAAASLPVDPAAPEPEASDVAPATDAPAPGEASVDAPGGAPEAPNVTVPSAPPVPPPAVPGPSATTVAKAPDRTAPTVSTPDPRAPVRTVPDAPDSDSDSDADADDDIDADADGKIPKLPELPELPELPGLPDLPKLPDVSVPRVELPESPPRTTTTRQP